MLNWPKQLVEGAVALVTALNKEPHKVEQLKHYGVNRQLRRRLLSDARKGKLKPTTIPEWLAFYMYGGIIEI